MIPSITGELMEYNFDDNMITFLVLQKGPIYYLPQAMAVYSQTGDGIWTGEKSVVNHIRNMFLYDMSIIVNPDIRRPSNVRFASTWLMLFLLRKQIDRSELELYYREAKKDIFVYSLKWICRQTLPFTEKAGLFIRTVMNGFWGLYYMLLRRAKAALGRWPLSDFSGNSHLS